MNLPSDASLPFFAYGLFKPGQLGYLWLRGFTIRSEKGCSMRGSLRIRDGLPIVVPGASGEVPGALLHFQPGSGHSAYQSIVEIEPDTQYVWEVRPVRNTTGESVRANILVGKDPLNGSQPLEEPDWDGKQDPLFTAALDVVEETVAENKADFEWNDLKPLFRLQMAYLLLWSAIERYVSLRYSLAGSEISQKVYRMALEPTFRHALGKVVRKRRRVFGTDDPGTWRTLDPMDPDRALKYYYKVRCNVTHRGKSLPRDFDTLVKSIEELTFIFREVLRAAFEEAAGVYDCER